MVVVMLRSSWGRMILNRGDSYCVGVGSIGLLGVLTSTSGLLGLSPDVRGGSFNLFGNASSLAGPLAEWTITLRAFLAPCENARGVLRWRSAAAPHRKAATSAGRRAWYVP